MERLMHNNCIIIIYMNPYQGTREGCKILNVKDHSTAKRKGLYNCFPKNGSRKWLKYSRIHSLTLKFKPLKLFQL